MFLDTRSKQTLQFLRLAQPIDESLLPIPRIAEKDKKYTFPFTFVVPDQLLPTSCNHQVKNDAVSEAHLQLPPSSGDPLLPSDNGSLTDDLFPDMARVSYYIQVKLVRRRESDGKAIILADSSRKLRITPNFEDAPPVDPEDHPGDYVLRAEKDIKKGIFKGKLGHLTVQAEQPKALRLNKDSLCPATTMVPVSLWFVPVDKSLEPPKLGGMTAKLKVATFFSTSRVNYIPGPSSRAKDPMLGYYGESILLSSWCMEGAKWSKELSSHTQPTYRATLNIPITAPKCKELVPSFSTCLMSRSYTLDLSISIQASTHTYPSVTLKVPLQVSHPSSPSSPVAVAAAANVEEFFTPRSVAPPPGSEQSRPEQSGPPGYSMFSSTVTPPPRIPSPVGISPGCG